MIKGKIEAMSGMPLGAAQGFLRREQERRAMCTNST
jgi:hypothetical protein